MLYVVLTMPTLNKAYLFIITNKAEGNSNKDHSKQETYRFNLVLNPFYYYFSHLVVQRELIILTLRDDFHENFNHVANY